MQCHSTLVMKHMSSLYVGCRSICRSSRAIRTRSLVSSYNSSNIISNYVNYVNFYRSHRSPLFKYNFCYARHVENVTYLHCHCRNVVFIADLQQMCLYPTVQCQFNGNWCNITSDFVTTPTKIGYCHTFNSGDNRLLFLMDASWSCSKLTFSTAL